MTRNEIIRMARRAGMAGMLTHIETTIDELERFAALVEVTCAPVQTAAQYLSGSDIADLQQLDAEFSDGEGWCLPKARMKRLAELGVIRHGGGGHYSITSFGRLTLGEEFSRLPLETVEECNARIGKEHNAITAAGKGDQHGAE